MLILRVSKLLSPVLVVGWGLNSVCICGMAIMASVGVTRKQQQLEDGCIGLWPWRGDVHWWSIRVSIMVHPLCCSDPLASYSEFCYLVTSNSTTLVGLYCRGNTRKLVGKLQLLQLQWISSLKYHTLFPSPPPIIHLLQPQLLPMLVQVNYTIDMNTVVVNPAQDSMGIWVISW